MKLSRELTWDYIEKGKIVPYEKELIENLRDKYYDGIPLSVVLSSSVCCRTWCHHMAFQLSRGLDYYTIVRGNINIYPIDDEPNHSWVEKDGWVYDTTDGFKWEKQLYYDLFDAKPIEMYNENNYHNFWFYQKEMKHQHKCEDQTTLVLILELIELLELEKPTFHSGYLQGEIDFQREKEGITERLPKEVVKEYKKIVFEMVEKQKHL